MAQTGYEEEARLYAQPHIAPRRGVRRFRPERRRQPRVPRVVQAGPRRPVPRHGACQVLCRSPCARSTSPAGPFHRNWKDSGPQSGRSSPTLRGRWRLVPWWPRLPRPCAATSTRRDAAEADAGHRPARSESRRETRSSPRPPSRRPGRRASADPGAGPGSHGQLRVWREIRSNSNGWRFGAAGNSETMDRRNRGGRLPDGAGPGLRHRKPLLRGLNHGDSARARIRRGHRRRGHGLFDALPPRRGRHVRRDPAGAQPTDLRNDMALGGAGARAFRSTRNLTELIRYSIDLYSRLEAETGQADRLGSTGARSPSPPAATA